jgi:predicted ATPase
MTEIGWQTTAPSTARFVGRATERARWEGVLDEVLAGRPRVVIVAGEAGIGKTRAARELTRRARERGVTVFAGSCYEGEGPPPLWPWIQIVRALSDEAVDLFEELDSWQLAVIGRVVPDVVCGRSDLPEVADVEPAASRFRLFDAVVQLFRQVCARGPVLIALEDMHWSDGASILLLETLIRQVDRGPLAVLATCRDADTSGPVEVPALDALRQFEGVERLVLGGLTEVECGELIESLGVAGMDPAALRRIWQESHGSPLFVQELARSLRERGGLGFDSVGTTAASRPDSVRDLIRLRLANLSAETREVLRAASVVGREVPIGVNAWGRVRTSRSRSSAVPS